MKGNSTHLRLYRFRILHEARPVWGVCVQVGRRGDAESCWRVRVDQPKNSTDPMPGAFGFKLGTPRIESMVV